MVSRTKILQQQRQKQLNQTRLRKQRAIRNQEALRQSKTQKQAAEKKAVAQKQIISIQQTEPQLTEEQKKIKNKIKNIEETIQKKIKAADDYSARTGQINDKLANEIQGLRSNLGTYRYYLNKNVSASQINKIVSQAKLSRDRSIASSKTATSLGLTSTQLKTSQQLTKSGFTEVIYDRQGNIKGYQNPNIYGSAISVSELNQPQKAYKQANIYIESGNDIQQFNTGVPSSFTKKNVQQQITQAEKSNAYVGQNLIYAAQKYGIDTSGRNQQRVNLSQVNSYFKDVGMSQLDAQVFSPISAEAGGTKGFNMVSASEEQDGKRSVLSGVSDRDIGRVSDTKQRDNIFSNFFGGMLDDFQEGRDEAKEKQLEKQKQFGTATAQPINLTQEQRKKEFQSNIWTANPLQLAATSKEYEKLTFDLDKIETEQEQKRRLEKLSSLGAEITETPEGFDISPPTIDVIPGKAKKQVPITSFDFDTNNTFSKIALGTNIITRTAGAVGGKVTTKATEKYYKAKGFEDDLDVIRKEFQTNITQEQYGTQQYDPLTGKAVPFFKPVEITVPELTLGERKKQAEKLGEVAGVVGLYAGLSFVPIIKFSPTKIFTAADALFYSQITGSIGKRAVREGGIVRGTKQFIKEEPFNAIMLGSIGAFKVGKGAYKAYPEAKAFTLKTGREFAEFEKGLLRSKKGQSQVLVSESEYIYDYVKGRWVKKKNGLGEISRIQAVEFFKILDRDKQVNILKEAFKKKGIYSSKDIEKARNFMKEAGLSEIRIKDRLAELKLRIAEENLITLRSSNEISELAYIQGMNKIKNTRNKLVIRTKRELIGEFEITSPIIKQKGGVKQVQEYDLGRSLFTKSGIGGLKSKSKFSQELLGAKALNKIILGTGLTLQQKQLTRQKERQDTANILRFGLATKQKEEAKQIPKLRYKTRQKIDTTFSQLILQRTKQTPTQKEDYKFLTPNILIGGTTQTLKIKKPKAPKIPKFPFGNEEEQRQTERLARQPTNLYVKSRGKFEKINKKPLQRNIARDMGFYVTDNTLSRQFKLVKAKGKVSKPSFNVPANYGNIFGFKFRAYKQKKGQKIPLQNRFIERKSYVGDTANELRKLNVAKFISQQKRKTSKAKPTNIGAGLLTGF